MSIYAEISQPASDLTRRTAEPGHLQRLLLFILALGANAALLWFFHDHSWWGPDDGQYAHTAERLFQGEVLNRDIEEIRMGYIHFLHVASFRLFGIDLVALRYPLLLAALAQSALVFWLFVSRGTAIALAASLTSTTLGLILFVSPTAHWYCLLLAVAIIGALTWMPREGTSRLLVVGLLLGLMFFMRQLSGVIMGCGIVTLLLLEPHGEKEQRGSITARCMLSLVFLGLLGYLIKSGSLFSFNFFGLGPLLMVAYAIHRTTASWQRAVAVFLALASGLLIAGTPLVYYHVAHYSLQAWWQDSVVHALAVSELPFITIPDYADLLVHGVRNLAAGRLDLLWNGVFWIALPLMTAFHAIALLMNLRPSRGLAHLASDPRALLPLFYAIVSLHYQIPVYLFYSAGLSAVGLLWVLSFSRTAGHGVAVLLTALGAIAVYYHAGQPLSRGSAGIVEGKRIALSLPGVLDRCGLRLDPAEAAIYRRLLTTIARETPEGGAIFALPQNPELYFLSRRRNPFRFYNTAIGVTNDRELEAVSRKFAAGTLPIVIYDGEDKYNTPYAYAIKAQLMQRYERIEKVGRFEVYRLAGEAIE